MGFFTSIALLTESLRLNGDKYPVRMPTQDRFSALVGFAFPCLPYIAVANKKRLHRVKRVIHVYLTERYSVLEIKCTAISLFYLVIFMRC